MQIELDVFFLLRNLAEYKAAKLALADRNLSAEQRSELEIARDVHLAALKAYGQKVAA